MGLFISEECYNYLENKYKKLIHNICKHISGDPAVNSSHEDNKQELLIKCIEAVYAYAKKISEPDFTKFIKTKLFDQYIKTCLWNLKNSTGNIIVKNAKVYKAIALGSPEEDGGIDVADPFPDAVWRTGFNLYDPSGYLDPDLFLEDLKEITPPKITEALNHIVTDPKLLKETGSLNVAKLSRMMGVSWSESKAIILKIENVLRKEILS